MDRPGPGKAQPVWRRYALALEAELEATVTECMAAKSNEDILRAKVERLEGVLAEVQRIAEAEPQDRAILAALEKQDD